MYLEARLGLVRKQISASFFTADATRNSFIFILPCVEAAWRCLGRMELEKSYIMALYIFNHPVYLEKSGSSRSIFLGTQIQAL
jgi:hypothetical protein